MATALTNRVYLSQRLGWELEAATASGRPLAVLYVGIESSAPGVTASLAKALAREVRGSDAVVQVGDDELLVCMAGTHAAGAGRVGGLIQQKLRKGWPGVVSTWSRSEVSIGIALAPDHGDDLHSLIQRADLTMQAAREQMEGGCHFYSAELESVVVPRALDVVIQRAWRRPKLAAWLN